MKRHALNHTKMDLLMRYLDVPRYVAVGILESLWHLTSKEAPCGDIGKLSNERIAIGIEWRGAKNRDAKSEADRLVRALVDAGWIEVSSKWRLVIHDWQEHADDSVKKYVKRNGLQFAGPDLSRTIPEMERLPEPEPEARSQTPDASERLTAASCAPPLRFPKPKAPTAADMNAEPSQRFEELWAMWPLKTGIDSAGHDWTSHVTVLNEEKVFACARRFLASDQAARGIIPNLGSAERNLGWIAKCAKDRWECDWPKARDSPGGFKPRNNQEDTAEMYRGL
jgi:hypothetical protein